MRKHSRSPLLALTLVSTLCFGLTACTGSQSDPDPAAKAAVEKYLDQVIKSNPGQICSVLNADLAPQCNSAVNAALSSEATKKIITTVANTSIKSSNIDPATGAGDVTATVFGFEVKLKVAKQADGSWQVNLG